MPVTILRFPNIAKAKGFQGVKTVQKARAHVLVLHRGKQIDKIPFLVLENAERFADRNNGALVGYEYKVVPTGETKFVQTMFHRPVATPPPEKQWTFAAKDIDRVGRMKTIVCVDLQRDYTRLVDGRPDLPAGQYSATIGAIDDQGRARLMFIVNDDHKYKIDPNDVQVVEVEVEAAA